jgi:hypothetical protein
MKDPKNKMDNNELDEIIEDSEFIDDDITDIDSSEQVSIIEIPDDIMDSDIIINNDDDAIDVKIDNALETDFIDEEELEISKHKIQGKHSLKYDSIFKGKKEEPLSDNDFETMSSFHNESFEVDKSSIYWFESIDNENYVKEKRVKEKVYEVLLNNTDLNFLNNRRKPSKVDFNNYYSLLKNSLKDENFTNTELFNELAVYFSDNLFNMFKLLDSRWRNIIMSELREHIGKFSSKLDVNVKNLTIGAEIEFDWISMKGENQIITGMIIDIDEDNYTVDSMENIYNLSIDKISKILNNNKYKYNLNRLDDTDFI